MLHHIRKSILGTLATADSRRYGELKPENLDGNVFTYHLKQLINDKFITKQDDGAYALLPRGKDYIVHRYEDALLQAHSILLIAVRRGDEWLMRERLVQPLIGMAGFVHGEPVANEPVVNSATRRFSEKTGYDIPLTIHSSGLIRVRRGDTIESFSHAILLTGETSQHIIPNISDKTGRHFWLHESDMHHPGILPSCADLIMRVKQNDTTPFDLTYDLPADTH